MVFNKIVTSSLIMVVLGSLFISIVSIGSGMTTLFSDTYLPSKYIIVEKYPIRIIMYGQLAGDVKYENGTYTSSRMEYILKMIEKLGELDTYQGQFNDSIDINVNSDFKSLQSMSSIKSGSIND